MKSKYTVMASRLKILGFATYQDYLKSELWTENKAKFKNSNKMKQHIGEHGWCCEFCLGEGMLSVHHWTYKRLGEEYANDLSLICDTCHKRVHSWNRKGDNLWRATKLLRRWSRKGNLKKIMSHVKT